MSGFGAATRLYKVAEREGAAPCPPRYYQICLVLTIIECVIAFTIALSLWVNLMPIWVTLPEAEHLNVYEQYVTSGYGFWGAMWAIPNYVMLKTTDDGARRKWGAARWGVCICSGGSSGRDQIWSGSWQWYVVL